MYAQIKLQQDGVEEDRCSDKTAALLAKKKQQDGHSLPDPSLQEYARHRDPASHARLPRESVNAHENSPGETQAELRSLRRDAIQAPG